MAKVGPAEAALAPARAKEEGTGQTCVKVCSWDQRAGTSELARLLRRLGDDDGPPVLAGFVGEGEQDFFASGIEQERRHIPWTRITRSSKCWEGQTPQHKQS